jgi:type II secretion system protein G
MRRAGARHIRRPQPQRKERAFTLIELLVVIAIIGLLASIVLVALNSARSKARDAKRVADLREIQAALELYYSDNGQYPQTGCDSTGYSGHCWNTFIPQQYIAQMPMDPLNVLGSYGYYYSSSTKPCGTCCYTVTNSVSDYVLFTRLENPSVIPNSCSGTIGADANPNLNYVVGM